MPAWVTILASIGAIVVLYALYAILDFLLLHFWLPTHPLRPYARRPGRAHALITGASAGIGLGIAQELVRQGFGVVLLGHLPDELATAKAHLEHSTPGASVRVVVMDAITATPEAMERMVSSLSDLDLTILVNNVGGNPVALPPFRAAATYDAHDVDRVIDQNARFMARLTPLVLRTSFSRAAAGGRCLVLTLGSGAQIGLPWLTLYSGTKAFNVAFTQGLAREVARDAGTAHVDCLAVVPGDVRTQGNCYAVGRWDPGWEAYGRCVVRTADGAVRRGRRSVSPYWLHDVQYWVLGWLGEGARTRAVGEIIGAKREMHNADVKRE